MTTIRVKTTVDVSRIAGAEKQVAYALSVAINESMKRAQTKERAHLAEVFTIRRKTFVNQSVKITQFAKKNTLLGEIAMDPPGQKADDLFNKFELGATKKPIGGRNLAIPVLGSPIRKSKRTIVKPEDRPRALLSGSQRGKRSRFAFLKPAEGNKPAEIFLRIGKQVKLAYVLKPEVPTPPVLKFVDTVTAEINRVWPEEFDKAWTKALATARK
jgi:hypothetical protein